MEWTKNFHPRGNHLVPTLSLPSLLFSPGMKEPPLGPPFHSQLFPNSQQHLGVQGSENSMAPQPLPCYHRPKPALAFPHLGLHFSTRDQCPRASLWPNICPVTVWDKGSQIPHVLPPQVAVSCSRMDAGLTTLQPYKGLLSEIG